MPRNVPTCPIGSSARQNAFYGRADRGLTEMMHKTSKDHMPLRNPRRAGGTHYYPATQRPGRSGRSSHSSPELGTQWTLVEAPARHVKQHYKPIGVGGFASESIDWVLIATASRQASGPPGRCLGRFRRGSAASPRTRSSCTPKMRCFKFGDHSK